MGKWVPPLLISALDGGEWLASPHCRFAPEERAPGTVGGPQRRSGCCEEEKNLLSLPGIELRFL
jgi:hypothetical protein